jgi:hypothetical protein
VIAGPCRNGVCLIAAETVYMLKHLPRNTFGVVYLLGVVRISTVWGFGLASCRRRCDG